ncbi:MAG: AMP-binding protein, partial [Bacteroidales bacterium]|nr:AMP-binding protein [Bacteroidales bacterium]
MEFQAVQFKSLNKILESSFKDHWGRPALSNYQGTTLTYEDVSRNIAMLHLCYEKCGLKKGDKIAICSRNQANWGVSLLSALTYGAVPVPLLHEFKPENIHFLVNHSEAKVLFVDDTVWEGLSENEMPDLKIIFQISTFKYIYAADKKLKAVLDKMEESFAARYPDGFKPSDINYYEDSAEELALINYTSGTSGFSKGVMLPYRSLYTNLYLSGHVAEPQMNSSSEQVAMLPSAHMCGLQ